MKFIFKRLKNIYMFMFIQTDHAYGAIESGKSGDGIDSEESNVSLFGIYTCLFLITPHARIALKLKILRV